MNYYVIPGIKSNYKHESGPKLNRGIVINTICEQFDLTLLILRSKSKKRHIAYPRQLVMYYLFYHSEMNTVKIGKLLNRDHTTVIHSLQKIRDLMAVDSTIQDQVSELRNKIVENHR